MWPISLSRRSWTWESPDLTRKADIDHQACQSMLVSSQPICIYKKERLMTGARVEPVRSTLFATVSASGCWPDAVQWHSTWTSPVITSSAIARCQQTLHSAMERISTSGSGVQRITEVSGPLLEPPHSGLHSVTGGLLSTDETTAKFIVYQKRESCQTCFNVFKTKLRIGMQMMYLFLIVSQPLLISVCGPQSTTIFHLHP